MSTIEVTTIDEDTATPGVFSTADISSIPDPRGDSLLSRNDEPVSALDLIPFLRTGRGAG
jgi:hypothetical protein